MPMTPPRKHIALAIDGGGAKGLIVSQALVTLEKELGGPSPLPLIRTRNASIKVLSGTSTGAVITAGIAVGMTAAEISSLYENFLTSLFTPVVPRWIPEKLRNILIGLIGLTRPSLYPKDGLANLLRKTIDSHTGTTDITLGELHERFLAPNGQTLIITAGEIAARHTKFLKSYSTNDRDWKLWEAVYASSAAPTVFPVFTRPDLPGRYYTDGGVGSFGNPALVAAREAVEWNGYAPADVSVFSFGTGWIDALNFVQANGMPSKWNILDWAEHAPYVILDEAIRIQSVDLIERFVDLADQSRGLDFRRFQTLLETDINPFAPADDTIKQMIELGKQMGERIQQDKHPLHYYGQKITEEIDPEGIIEALENYQRSKQAGGITKLRP